MKKGDLNVARQKNLLERLGFETADWRACNALQKNELFAVALNAQLLGQDKAGNRLTEDELFFLAALTDGRQNELCFA